MIRWLQTSLFGPQPESPPFPAPVPRHADIPGPDADFATRWQKACAGVHIRVVTIPRLRQGWKLEWKRGEPPILKVPRAVLDAPDDILVQFVAWSRLAQVRNTINTRRERKLIETRLHAWLDSFHALDPHAAKLANGRRERRLQRLQPKGTHHDLEGVLAAVNAEYFGGSLRARITWSRRWGGLSTQTMARDGDGNTYPLLTISRGYDHPSATPEIVGGVVYHECLHIVLPPEEGGGRRIVHGREFRRREKEYRHYTEWVAWHRDVLPGIIRRGSRRH